nr:MAG TPA: restriction endonuclease [Caudoviricetes sp.]
MLHLRLHQESPYSPCAVRGFSYAQKVVTMAKAGRQERGYGQAHKSVRKRLIYLHKDGTPCWWCGEPMFREPGRNPDGFPLAADHVNAGGAAKREQASRLLHFTCNSTRKDGDKDHLRPAVAPWVKRDKPVERKCSSVFDWSMF